MAVIGPEHDGFARLALRILLEELAEHAHHIDIAIEMIALEEGEPVRLAFCRAEMREMDARAKPFGHPHQIIDRVDAERTRAEADAVRGVRHGIEQGLIIRFGFCDARQPEKRARRIIRMQGQLDAEFIRPRADGLKKLDQVLAQHRLLPFGREILALVDDQRTDAGIDVVVASRTVADMHSRGLVDKRRSPGNKRLVCLRLTDDGVQIHGKAKLMAAAYNR